MRSVLFVDDEPRVLDGLRRVLHAQRRSWEMEFIEGGPSALERLSGRSFDVVVSDARMPGIDGAALLSRVKEMHPETVRVILSGHTDPQSSLLLAKVAHQFLTKPCDSNTIRDVIEQACALQEILGSQELRALVGAIGALPPSPRIFTRLTTAMADPDADAKGIARIVEEDPAIAAKVLQFVNSSFFAPARRLTNLQDAVAYLGMERLKSLALSVEVFRDFGAVDRTLAKQIEQVQVRSLATAELGSRIVADRRLVEPTFLAGLLHDVGSLALLSRDAAHAANRAAAAESARQPIHVIEEREFGVSHAEVGGYLLGVWGLGADIVAGVTHHHHPERSGQLTLGMVASVHIANALVDETGLGSSSIASTADSAMNAEYVKSIGVTARLPEWRAMLADLEGGS